MADKTEKLAELVARAKVLANKDKLTDEEVAESEAVMAEAKQLHESISRGNALDDFTSKMSAKIDKPSEEGPKGESLYDDFIEAGFKPQAGSKAVLPAHIAVKSATWDSPIGDLAPVRTEGVALGVDERRLFPVFFSVGVDAGTTSVDVLRQKSRTLATPASMVRAIAATSQKPETASVREIVSLAMHQVASVESGIPNIFLHQPGFKGMVDNDLRLAYERALDFIVVDALDDADPDGAGDPGIDLTENIVFAAAEMVDRGYNPSVIAINPEEYAELTLLKGEAQTFVRADPLSGFRFVQSPLVGFGSPYLIDPAAAGRLYISGATLQVFEENDGGTNTSLVRYEGTAAFHVERLDAILRVTAGS